jgi:CDP-glucose 4,6-dehydratase
MNQQPQPPVEWTSRHVLVTGADGFVGHWLVQALAASGARVCALIRLNSSSNETFRRRIRETGVEIAQGNVTNLDFISRLITHSKIDTVYHLAAINTNTGSDLSPYEIFETNIRGVYTVLEACRTAPKPARAVVASSKEVEDCFLPGANRIHHPYMTSKAAAELVTRAYSDTFGLPVALVRSDNIYGGGDFNWSRLVPGTVRSILRGETPVIRSSGLLQRDYVYVEDAVAAYIAIGERLDDTTVKGKLFRVATGLRTSVLDMVKQIARAAGRSDLKPQVLNEKSEERIDVFYTPEFEQTVLGWKSRCSLEEGLSRTCEWYRNFFREDLSLIGAHWNKETVNMIE